MRIISVQSIAGGTGVTTICKELIEERLTDRNRILAIDFGLNQGLERQIAEFGFAPLGDVRALFNHSDAIWQRPMNSLPDYTLLRLPQQAPYSDLLERDDLLQFAGLATLGHALEELRRCLTGLSFMYDWCIVDMSKAKFHLLHMMIELSHELHFCARKNTGVAGWAEYKRKFLSASSRPVDQVVYKQADRGRLCVPMT